MADLKDVEMALSFLYGFILKYEQEISEETDIKKLLSKKKLLRGMKEVYMIGREYYEEELASYEKVSSEYLH